MTLNNQAAITAFLAGKGLTAAQIAGVEGNLTIESSGRPEAYNAREGAIGIVQWEGGRRTALQSFARGRGTTETDLTTQLNFMWQELTTTERGALTALLAAGDPTSAATAFDQKYERSSAASLPARQAAARAIAAGGIAGGSGQVDTGSAGPSSGGATAGATNAGFDMSTLPFPLNLLGSAANAAGGVAAGALSWIGHFLLDAFLVLLGIVLVIIAVKMLATSDEHAAPQQPAQPQQRSRGDEDQAPAPARGGHAKHAEGGAAADDAEVAAVAA